MYCSHVQYIIVVFFYITITPARAACYYIYTSLDTHTIFTCKEPCMHLLFHVLMSTTVPRKQPKYLAHMQVEIKHRFVA